MSSAVAELEASLQAMLQLKPPGVSGSKINAITALCAVNIECESVLIQKLYTHFKKAPATHKLGVLYVVDSVTRKWSEQAKATGQTIDHSAIDGSAGAAVNRVKELLPSLMNDIIQSAPSSDQKDKIRKLVDIWEKGQTFPMLMIVNFKEKLEASQIILSTTPPGSPPQSEAIMGGRPQSNASADPPPDTSSILAVLANMAKQNQNPAPTPAPPPPQPIPSVQASSYAPAGQQNGAAAGMNYQQHMSMPQHSSGVMVSAPNGNYAPLYQGHNGGVQNIPVPSNQVVPFAGQPQPVPNLPLGGSDSALQQQLQIIQMLAAQGIPQEQWAQVLSAINISPPAPAGFPQPPQFGQNVNLNQTLQSGNGWTVKQEDSSDRNGNGSGYNNGTRSLPNHTRRRSRSPQRNGAWNRDREANYSDLRDRSSRGVRGSGGGNDQYRQRSPPRRVPSPPNSAGGNPKWTDFDASLPDEHIKVLSRTLFVGGVSISEQELRGIFDRIGNVQTCIVNKDKRHAFVKMFTRHDAEIAKTSMDKNHSTGSMRTRWGVGFGPRDCSDYQTGISIIPIERLTDADRKWMVSAEYGGSGGRPIEGGLCVEEPDIEIGQGVSSKAISRRMQTDTSGHKGPKSGRDYKGNHRHQEHRGSDDRNTQAVTAPPPVPNFQFPFNFAPDAGGMLGFPMMHPNFMMPPQQQNGNGNGNGQEGYPPGPSGSYRG